MPVILHPEHYKTWLTADSNSLSSFFSDYLENELEYFEISTAINSPKNNEASLLTPTGQSSFTF